MLLPVWLLLLAAFVTYSNASSINHFSTHSGQKYDDIASALNSTYSIKQAANGITTIPTLLNSAIVEYYYLEKPLESKDTDETIILRTADNVVHISHDHGATWADVASANEVVAIYRHPYDSNVVYLITSAAELLLSTDRGFKFNTVKTPTLPHRVGYLQYMTFHKTHPDWLIWHGTTDCSKVKAGQPCAITAYYSKNNGGRWTEMQAGVNQCAYVVGLQKSTNDDLVFCERLVGNGNSNMFYRQLVSSTDYFKNAKNEIVHFDDIIGFTAQNDFLIVAAVAADRISLRADVSIDGATFAHAAFPPNFAVGQQQAYTILDTSTKSIVMHVTVSATRDSEFGTILKSNSNGTSYVTSLEYANRNYNGFVDFEKMQGIEGVSLVNVVDNPTEASDGQKKQLKTKITFNDGGSWSFLESPQTDSLGQPTGCTGASEQCSLNLHGYTERVDVRDTFSSASAVGLMIGVGNVGPTLTAYGEGNTYLTRDGGATWKEIQKGTYMWEYGDQGSIIILVNDKVPTDSLLYTFDEGSTWQTLKFYDEMIQVNDISTVPSDTSRKFLIYGTPADSYGQRAVVVQVDFTGSTKTKCVLNQRNPANDDFELWSPARPGQTENCLFGHETQYYRKLPDHFCYIGDKVPQPHSEVRNCECTRHDYECDANYYLATDGSCQLVAGYSPPDHSAQCRQMPNQIEWFEPTGYRRVPLSTCVGGQILDNIQSFPCPGHEGEYQRKHGGIRGFGLFLLITLPFVMAGIVAYVLYNHYYGQYGQIRLGETDFDTHLNLGADGILKYPVIAVSAVVTFLSALPVIGKSLFQNWRRRAARPSRLYRSRTNGSSYPLSRPVGAGRYEPVSAEESRGLSNMDDDEDVHVFGSSDDDMDDDDYGEMTGSRNQAFSPPTPSSPQLSAAPSPPPHTDSVSPTSPQSPLSPASPSDELMPKSPPLEPIDSPTK
ncbi:hypothetical protein V1512DRAFT_260731 [Lipomyces arxii]|uniref:uncharacterized protein n=1 Tax=Lipomyces arxii TaxID=56418 RepID=UPI0034CEE0D1